MPGKQGPHPHKALSARTIQTKRNAGRSRRIADGNGLYLFIDQNGAKRWVLRTVVQGHRRDIGLGSAALVPLQEAREDAQRLRRLARKGGDPLAERRRDQRPVPTFEEAATQVHESHSAGFRNEKHRRQWLASLKPVFSVFGAKRVNAVTSADILEALKARWQSHPETSRRVLQRIRVVMDWCLAQGHVSGTNPTVGVTKALPKHRGPQEHHAALAYDQVAAFIKVLRKSDSSESVRLAFEFAILTAGRTSEVLKANWSEIDLEAKVWTIPAARMKAGVEHRVPLSDGCVEILRRAQKLTDGGTYVFPGRSEKRPLSNMVFLMALRRMKREGVTPHGFRSSFRDWAAERTNFAREVCEAALAHRLKDKTEAAYNRTDLFERRRELMATWAAYATAKAATVVPIRARAGLR